eukprot:1567825-Prymnesium_polylepis.2
MHRGDHAPRGARLVQRRCRAAAAGRVATRAPSGIVRWAGVHRSKMVPGACACLHSVCAGCR